MKNSLLPGEIQACQIPANEHAPLPYPRPRATLQLRIEQYRIILLTLLSDYRSDWPFHVFAGLLFPVALVFFAKAIAGQMDPGLRIYMLGGNMAMSIAFGPPLFLMGKLGWARQNREFDYWISLPISQLVLTLAIISVGLLFALPGLLGSYLLGTLILGLPWSGGWLLLFLVPLGALSLTGVGMLLGNISPNGQVANVLGNILITIVGFLSPMLIPLQNLPGPLQGLARFVPTTYIADAFRVALGGQSIASLPFDVLVLIVTSLVLLGISHWTIDWRVK